jgi:hypothetical protein
MTLLRELMPVKEFRDRLEGLHKLVADRVEKGCDINKSKHRACLCLYAWRNSTRCVKLWSSHNCHKQADHLLIDETRVLESVKPRAHTALAPCEQVLGHNLSRPLAAQVAKQK